MQFHKFIRLLRSINIIVILATTASVISSNEKNSQVQGLYDLGNLGLESLDGMIIAIGDSNADQYRDIFTLSGDQRSISLHLWHRERYEFVSVPNNPVIPQTVGKFLITNIILTDINYDGRLDILAMGVTDPNSDSTLKMEVWYGIDGTSFASGITIPSSLSSHPLFFDSQGSMSMDLLGLPSSLPSVFKIWKNQAFRSNTSIPFSIQDVPFDTQINCKLPNPHCSTFIDLDGDCLADIFLTCENPNGKLSYQIWINKKSQGYSLARTDELPFGTKRISFADMDRDGTIDMVLATCPTPDDCSIHVAYNQQIPLCNSRSKLKCRDPQNLCTSDPGFRFSFDSAESGFTTLNLGHLFPYSRLITELSTNEFIGPSPMSIQIGDYNLDGYPDLLFIAEPISSNYKKSGVPQLLESVPCTRAICTALETQKHRRAFRPLSSGADALSSIEDAQGLFFMDVNEDGSLDIVIQRMARDGHGPASRTIAFLKNNYFNDAFFLKAIMLNGACSSRCRAKDGQAEHRPYGVNYAGASYKFTIQDTYGERRATAVGQVPFNMYASPTTPYCFFGLGRTNNYVENLFVGSTRHQSEHYINIEGVLPNSQLVINPYQFVGSSSPTSWKKELYLKPGDWIPWVILTLAIATLILAIIVGVLHINEKREDERERRRKAHTINFDAL